MAVHDNELAPFVLQRVADLESGDAKGSGAYGAVYEVTVNDIPCIAKRIHDILVNQVSSRERGSIQEKFRQECILLSKLRHPNIVHFVGVNYGKVPGDLTLVMERLHTDLGKFLDSRPAQIPLSVKLAILLDVSYGLLYLHTYSPPIIHRDLTANNVLLTKDLRAKIADLGVSKLLDLQRQAKTHTKAPGSWLYMPPEALKEKSVYDVSLDAFSFGHLSLYTANQDFPNVYEVTMTPLLLQQQTVQILKRRKAIDRMGSDHCLYPMIVACLQDSPAKRPTTTELTKTLKELTEKHPKSLGDVMEANAEDLHQSKQQLSHNTDTVREQGREIQRLTAENLELRNSLEIERVKAITFQEDFEQERRDRESTQTKVAEMETRYTHQLQTMGEELHRVATELNAHKHNLANIEAVMQKHSQQTKQQLADKEQEVGQMNKEIARLREEVQSKTQQVKQYKKQVEQYRLEMDPLKQQSAILKEQVEHFAQESEEMKKQNASLRQELEKLRRERDRIAQGRSSPSSYMTAELQREAGKREAFERRTAELEQENDFLRQDIRSMQMEIDQLRHHLRIRQDPPSRPALAPPQSSNLALPPRFPPMVHSALVESSQRLGHTGIDSEIHQAAKHIKTKVGDDLSLPASGDDLRRRLVCPVCRVQFRLGEIQKFRKHVEICHKTRK